MPMWPGSLIPAAGLTEAGYISRARFMSRGQITALSDGSENLQLSIQTSL